MNLSELQRYFTAAATSGAGPIAGLEQVFKGSSRLSAQARLAIYNRGYYYRLLDALASVFRETQHTLGNAEFTRVGLAYLARHPSRHPALERVGELFAAYLRSEGAIPTCVADLAALEWARLCALVAPNPRTLAKVSAIQVHEFPEARLGFVAALHCLELDPRALHCYARRELSSDPPANTEQAALPSSGVAVWRAGHAVQHESLDPLEFQALRAATDGSSMAQVCARFDTGHESEDAERAFQTVASWFARQWVETIA